MSALKVCYTYVLICMYAGLSCEVNNGGCEHVCTSTKSGVTCSCNDGYQLTGNYRNCKGMQ